MEWWFVVKTYTSGEWEKFRFFTDEATARAVGAMINPTAKGTPDKLIIFAYRGGDWVTVHKKGV